MDSNGLGIGVYVEFERWAAFDEREGLHVLKDDGAYLSSRNCFSLGRFCSVAGCSLSTMGKEASDGIDMRTKEKLVEDCQEVGEVGGVSAGTSIFIYLFVRLLPAPSWSMPGARSGPGTRPTSGMDHIGREPNLTCTSTTCTENYQVIERGIFSNLILL